MSDSIAEWKGEKVTVALEYFAGGEKVATPGSPDALWMSAQAPLHWAINQQLSVTVRPELYWDRDGRTTGFRQTVIANTTTVEVRIPFHDASAILRVEHRIDNSRGPDGGFFHDGETAPGVVGLTPTQNLFILGVILTFDSGFHL